jgi:hypothetical protein
MAPLKLTIEVVIGAAGKNAAIVPIFGLYLTLLLSL